MIKEDKQRASQAKANESLKMVRALADGGGCYDLQPPVGFTAKTLACTRSMIMTCTVQCFLYMLGPTRSRPRPMLASSTMRRSMKVFAPSLWPCTQVHSMCSETCPKRVPRSTWHLDMQYNLSSGCLHAWWQTSYRYP